MDHGKRSLRERVSANRIAPIGIVCDGITWITTVWLLCNDFSCSYLASNIFTF